MRVPITLDDQLVRELDRRVGPRQRSSFIAKAVRRALDDERLGADRFGCGSIADRGHEWDDDPAAWAAAWRRGPRRLTAGP